MPDVKSEVENYCPFGCSLDELDELGMCQHVIGFCTKDPNNPTGRLILEPLEAATKKRKNLETGEIEEVETGFLRTNGKLKEYVQEDKGDKLVNPLIPQTDHQSGQTHDHWKWFSWRVYNKNPEKRVPDVVPVASKVIKARPKRKDSLVAT